MVLGGQVELVTEQELRRVFEVNVFAVWSLIRLVLPGMRERRNGVIINLSSTSGRIAMPGLGAIEPGPCKTDMFARNKRMSVDYSDPDHSCVRFDARADALFERTVARQAGDPQDVADRIVMLLKKPRGE